MRARWLRGLLAIPFFSTSGCFWDESSIFFVPDLLVPAEAPSEVWVRVVHPQLPISFELPANYAAPIEARIPWLAKPEPLEERRETVETWAIRPLTRGPVNYAIEFGPLVITESDRLAPEFVRRLSAPRVAPDELVGFFRASCEPEVLRVLELSQERPVALGACTGVRLRVRWIPPSANTRLHEVLVAPVPGVGVLVAGAAISSRADDTERASTGPRIIDSIRIDPCVRGPS